MGYKIINLDDMLAELGEDRVKSILLDFSCPLNMDVENFLHNKATEFSKQSLSKTHLVFCSYQKKIVLIGYFTLAIKSIHLGKRALSNRLQGRASKFGIFDRTLKKYIISAPLIAQLGKNFKYYKQKLITGDEFLKMACEKIVETQSIFGGKIAYLECQNEPKLIEFYNSNGFVSFGERQLDGDEKDDNPGNSLVQMLEYMVEE